MRHVILTIAAVAVFAPVHMVDASTQNFDNGNANVCNPVQSSMDKIMRSNGAIYNGSTVATAQVMCAINTTLSGNFFVVKVLSRNPSVPITCTMYQKDDQSGATLWSSPQTINGTVNDFIRTMQWPATGHNSHNMFIDCRIPPTTPAGQSSKIIWFGRVIG